MPGLQYWFSVAALWLAGSFVITVILGIMGIRTMIPNKIAVFLIGMALLVMLLGWWTAAEQEEASAKREHKLDQISETLDLIKSSLPPVTAFTPVDNLSSFSNAQLRDRVLRLTAAMRTFEGGIKAAESPVMNPLPATATETQRHADWTARTNAMLERSTQAQNEFRVRFLPEALALREEMSKRLGRMPPYPEDRKTVALNYGMLAGVSPISDAADYLEELARQMAQ
jgi:hypothetical protein